MSDNIGIVILKLLYVFNWIMQIRNYVSAAGNQDFQYKIKEA